MVAAFVTSGAVLAAGLVTMVAQLWIARAHTAWEAALEIAKHDVARFEKAQDHLISAADAANRYMFHIPEIEGTGYHEREPYILPILDAIGRAKEEVAALPPFEGIERVESAITAIESVLAPPGDGAALRASWDLALVREGVRALNEGRSSRMRALTQKGRAIQPRRKRSAASRTDSIGGVPTQPTRQSNDR
jgi:hypothetical protein